MTTLLIVITVELAAAIYLLWVIAYNQHNSFRSYWAPRWLVDR